LCNILWRFGHSVFAESSNCIAGQTFCVHVERLHPIRFIYKENCQIFSNNYSPRRCLHTVPKEQSLSLAVCSPIQLVQCYPKLFSLSWSPPLCAIMTTEAVYECNYAKLATSSCKKCKTKIEKGALRIAKVCVHSCMVHSCCIINIVVLV